MNMRIQQALFGLIFLLASLSAAQAQKTVTIATGTAGTADHNAGPIYRATAASAIYTGRFAYLYTAAEMNAAGVYAGKISDMSWYLNKVATLLSTRNNQFRIYLKNTQTAAYNLPTQDWAVLISGATQVFNDTAVVPSAIGWVPFVFDQPFYYTGGSLEVMVEFDQTQAQGTVNGGSTLDFDWAWRTVVDRIYGVVNATALQATLSSSTNGQSTLMNDRRPDVRFTLTLPFNDIGVGAIASPTLTSCAGTHDVKARVVNFGRNQVDTFTVNWSLNDTLQTPVTFYTLLDTVGGSGSYSGVVTLGSRNFGSGNLSRIKAWTSLPNSLNDTVAVNDSGALNFTPAVSGTYTVGGSSPDFATITAAVNFLKQNGLCGPITFDIRAGTYNEYLELPQISGASSTNTITFQGSTTGTTEIIGNSPNTRATVSVVATDYVTFRNLRIENQTTGVDVWGVSLSGQADYITIESCSIYMPVTISTDVVGIVASNSITAATTEGNNANYLTIQNCFIYGGEKSIHLEGAGNTAPTVGNRIIGNTLTQAEDYGIYVDDQINFEVVGNNIYGIRNATTGKGMYSAGGYTYLIEKNKIDVVDYGIYLLDMNVSGNAYKRTRIINNMVRSSADYGIYLSDADSVDLYHNTVVGEPALYINDHNFLNIRNNIFYSLTDYAIEFLDATPIGTMNYNVYYSGMDSIIRFGVMSYANLAPWQAVQVHDDNSYKGDPGFVSATDLHIQGIIANDVGDPTVGVTEDIDGEARPSVAGADVDMGADEIKVLKNDAGVVAMNPACAGGDLVAVIRNFGVLNLNSATINWSVNGTVQTPVSFSGANVANLADTAISLGASGMVTGQTYDLKVWTSLPNGVNDLEKTNDSLVAPTFETGMNGTYSVGASGDFATPGAAVAALTQRGMCGDVALEIQSGSYTDRLAVKNIRKTDPSYTLTMASQTGNAADVQISYPSAADGNNYTILIEDFDKVILENLTIERTGNLTMGTAIAIEGADDVIIRNNLIIGDSTTTATNTTGTRSGIFSSGVTPENNMQVYGNVFSGNANGMWLNGGEVDYSEGLVIRNNTFSVTYTGFYVLYQDAPIIEYNYVTNSVKTSTAAFYGISVQYISGPVRIEGNEVYGYTSPGYGIRLRETKAPAGNKGLVLNNLVSLNGNAAAYGFTLESNSENIRFIHNTSLIKGGTNTATRAFYATAVDGQNDLINNIFINRGAGTAIYLTTTATPTIVTADYNMLYSLGANLAYWTANRVDLAALRSNSGKFANSVVQNIAFVSTENLRILDFADVLVGTPLGVTSDVDGNSRCSVPYVGGYEISPAAGSFTVDFSVPDTLFAGGRGLFINSALRSERRIHEWFVEGVFKGNSLNLLHVFPSAGSYELKLKSKGCSVSDSITKTVTVINSFAVPEIDFTANRTKIFEGEAIEMIDLSTQAPTGWFWTVTPSQGVSLATEFSQDPYIFFSEAGTYDVCLVADNNFGSSATVCKENFVVVYPVSTICTDLGSEAMVGKLYDEGGAFGPHNSNSNCEFLIDPCASEVTAYITSWDLADADDELRIYNGSTQDPNNLLATFNMHSVNPGGTAGITATSGTMLLVWKTDAATVGEGFALEWVSRALTQTQEAGFEMPDTAYSGAPVFVKNLAGGVKISTEWDMEFPNNVDISSTGSKLFHTYSAPGTYLIRQIVSGCGGMDTTFHTIEVIAPVLAPSPVDFTQNRATLTVNEVLQLTDISGNGPNNWRWEITPAAGVTFLGTANSPVVELTFSNLGSYDIKLVVSNAVGADSIIKTAAVRVIEYCNPNTGLLSAEFGMSRVRFAGIDQLSSIGELGYWNFTQNGQAARLGLGETYPIEIYRNAANQTMSRKVWIDWNQDGDFTDAGELVAQENTARTDLFTAGIQVPVNALSGITRMRVAAGYDSDPAGPCGPALLGEFEDYRIEVLGDISKPVITILGANPATIEAGYSYTDAGALASDNVDGNLTAFIVAISSVDSAIANTYEVRYVVVDAAGNVSDTAVRKVIVTPDVTAPLINLLGNATEWIEVNNTYLESGYTALDMPWGTNLAGQVLVTGNVITTDLGKYELTYSVTDAAGNRSEITRTVIVGDTTRPVATVNVNDTLWVEVNTSFTDPGVDVTDNFWNVNNVTVTGSVDITELGEYTLSYVAADGSGNTSDAVQRLVIVADRTAPVITLIGNDVVHLAKWQVYTDSLYTLGDNYNDSVDITVEVLGDWVNSVQEGLYYIQYKATDASGNVSYSAKRIIDVRGSNSLTGVDAISLKVYPNPSQGRIILESSDALSAGTQIKVMDAQGKQVYRKVLDTVSNQVELDLQILTPGMYLIQLSNGKSHQAVKVQIAR